MSAKVQKRARFQELSTEKKAALAARAREVNREHLQRVKHYVDSQKRLLEVSDDTVYVGGGEVSFAVFIAYGVLGFTSAFIGNPSGTLSFSGTDWSFGLAGWEGYGAAAFVLPPNELSGNGSVTVIGGGVEEGAFTLLVYDGNGVLYGNITGIVEGVGVGGGNISGSFSWSGS